MDLIKWLKGTNLANLYRHTRFKLQYKNSSNYWENRYLRGGTSGAGSYNRLAEYKAEFLNKLVQEENIQSVIEWGCGDGNQLKLANYPQYIGYDVSQTAINLCRNLFAKDPSKKFICIGQHSEEELLQEQADLTLSLDVIYHLVEDVTFHTYMQRLFSTSKKFVCIYASNIEEEPLFYTTYVRNRKFTDYVTSNIRGWKLIRVEKNKYPWNENFPDTTSASDFYVYKKELDS